jgi:hypothetical protein
VISAIVLVRMLAGNAPGGADVHLTVFTVAAGHRHVDAVPRHHLRLPVLRRVRGRGDPGRGGAAPAPDIPRAILGTAIFGGVYFTVVTAIEMMAFGTDDAGVAEVHRLAGADGRPRHVVHRQLGRRPDHPRRRVSAFGCCLACVVGASRLLFALARDLAPGHPLASTGPQRHPGPRPPLVSPA